MSDIANAIQSKLETDFIENAFPVWTSHGVKDEDVFIHSIGCSVWNTLGHELGYMAIVEGPAPVASGNDIRSDSVWIDKETNSPLVLIEFERYDGSPKGKSQLLKKLVNLMEAANRWEDKPVLLVLSAWSPGLVSAPDFEQLEKTFLKGTFNGQGSFIPRPKNCGLLLQRMVFEQEVDGLYRLNKKIYRTLVNTGV
jgi:hypothetical protein